MALEGMDVAQVQSLMSQITSTQQELTQQLSTLNSAITQGIGAPGSSWVGQDASTFASNWPTEYYTPLNTAISRLTDAATTIQNNLHAQDSASAT
jgi:uncharacterized protein YukE